MALLYIIMVLSLSFIFLSSSVGLTHIQNGSATTQNQTSIGLENINEKINQLGNSISSLNSTIGDLNEKAKQTETEDLAKQIFGAFPIYVFLGVIALTMFIPLTIDLIYAHRRQNKIGSEAGPPTGVRGLYRSLMTFGVILIVGTIIFYLLSLIGINNALQNDTFVSLVKILENLSLILGTALATIIAFYFGIRGSESAVEKAASIITGKEDSEAPKVTNTSPGDGEKGVELTAVITATFSEPIKEEHKNDYFLVKDSNSNKIDGQIQFVNGNKQILFDPTSDLIPDTKYTVSISAGIQDYHGNTLGRDYEWWFKTKSKTTQTDNTPAQVIESPSQEGLMVVQN